VTTVPTVIRYGERHRARVRVQGSWTEIAPSEVEQYVSEEHNPENTKGVEGVEVFVPSPMLQSGMCLVDTPGLGSVFAGNTAATRDFIPHIDAAIAVIGADPPISGDELALIEAVAQHVREIVVVLNKSDRVFEQERRTAIAFAQQMLEKRLKRPAGHIFEVSAIERFERRGPERDWPALLTVLEQLADQSGRSLARRAGERGIERLSEQVLALIAEERDALLRPIEESERRIAVMRQTLSDADRSMRDLGYLFTAEQQRLHDLFVGRRKEFLERTRPEVHREFQERLANLPRAGSGPSYRRRIMHEAQEITRRSVLPWLQQEQDEAERVYRTAAQRFVDLANDFLRRLAEAGIPELARMPHALDAERGFRAPSRFYFNELIHVARPASPLRLVADIVLGVLRVYGPMERDGSAFLDRLLEMNSSRVQSDLDDRVIESRQRLEADIRVLLLEISAAAQRALDRARAAKAAGSAAVEDQLKRLDALAQEVRNLSGCVAT
jgi:hypothetical protein